ncbi:MAG: hypothetical protein Fur003_0140 [Candidatus Dojkabacteria bacterium]
MKKQIFTTLGVATIIAMTFLVLVFAIVTQLSFFNSIGAKQEQQVALQIGEKVAEYYKTNRKLPELNEVATSDQLKYLHSITFNFNSEEDSDSKAFWGNKYGVAKYKKMQDAYGNNYTVLNVSINPGYENPNELDIYFYLSIGNYLCQRTYGQSDDWSCRMMH